MMKKNIAVLTSNILNPFVISIIVLILLALKASPNVMDAIAWIFIVLAISVLPVFIMVLFLLRLKKLDGFFNSPRQQRNKVYIAAAVLGVVDCVLLWYLNVPSLMLVTFYAGLTAVIIFTVINHFWKISLHAAFIAAGTSILITVYGAYMAWLMVFFPLVGWARVELKQHTVWQVIVGGVLASAVVIGVFWIFHAL